MYGTQWWKLCEVINRCCERQWVLSTVLQQLKWYSCWLGGSMRWTMLGKDGCNHAIDSAHASINPLKCSMSLCAIFPFSIAEFQLFCRWQTKHWCRIKFNLVVITRTILFNGYDLSRPPAAIYGTKRIMLFTILWQLCFWLHGYP